jgi:sugar/nucleoside kinase (ribokinase family)
VDIYRSSLDEIKILTNLSNPQLAIKAIHDYGVETVIVTLGNNGVLLSVGETIYKIPVCKLHETIDPTGAGDVFIGAFLAEYIRDKPILWCACVGSAAASLSVESTGPAFSGDKAEIYQRAHVLYEK